MNDTSVPQVRVLVADDEPLIQQVAVMLLRRLGYGGIVVPNGQEALRALDQQRFDVMLLDVSMPVLDGWETLQALRQLERAGRPRTPVVMISGHDLPEDRARYLNGGADAYLVKPLDASELDAALQRVRRR
jgi:CheY-like chemotaxis protein